MWRTLRPAKTMGNGGPCFVRPWPIFLLLVFILAQQPSVCVILLDFYWEALAKSYDTVSPGPNRLFTLPNDAATLTVRKQPPILRRASMGVFVCVHRARPKDPNASIHVAVFAST